MSEIRIYLFGPPRIEPNNENIEINRRKAAALLAYLEVNAQPYARDSLATLLWPDHGQAGARGSLRRELSRLKKMLDEPILSIDRETVGLNEQANVWLVYVSSKPGSHLCKHITIQTRLSAHPVRNF